MDNFSDRTLIERIDRCYQQLSGKPLPSPAGIAKRLWWLHQEAPYSLVAHGKGPDPHFIYANEYALRCFKYSREAFLQLPSRLSAASVDRPERQRMLNSLAANGIVSGYSGTRLTCQGEPFTIYDGVLWQLKDNEGLIWGQAALFWLSPEASRQPFAGVSE
jgi:hypothetical protein